GERGLRQVADVSELQEVIEECSREALQYFGSSECFIEKHLASPRHIEVQIIGDGAAHQHLWDRDCSVQRRNQKIVEIAPSPQLSDDLRTRMTQAALAIARHLSLRSLATVEFLVYGTEFFFMEVNPRLQVEHTVTEEVTGVDLVAAQLRLAM